MFCIIVHLHGKLICVCAVTTRNAIGFTDTVINYAVAPEVKPTLFLQLTSLSQYLKLLFYK